MHSALVAEVTPGEISAIVERVGAQCETLSPFELLLDRPGAGTVAFECPARPGAPARRL